jgi:acetyl-CoA carboxylase, biotin carboxylase subunit
MHKRKNTKNVRKQIVSLINFGLLPAEYSFNVLTKLFKKFKKVVPLVYDEVENVISNNLVHIDGKHKGDLGVLGDTITSNLIKKVPRTIDESELRKIVKGKSSQTFIDMLARGLSVSGIAEREYTVIPKEKIFKRILIANRGEIALRVIRVCRELGIESLIVYSKPDKDTLAVKFADKSYCIGPAISYLDINKIIKIAKKAKADAIHPGYGFLAENAKFAKYCEKNKIVFIGPSSKTISILGDKVKAKKTAIKSGVKVIGGNVEPIRDKKHAHNLVKKMGFPVIIKAAAGGGGKGMRIIRKQEDIDHLLDSAQGEALLAFGDKSVYMEKYIEDPRHVEFQILADSYGNVVHLGERDCSVQRKHQKLIEESPSPSLSLELRERMGEAAVKVASAAKYRGAGTVEFLLDKNNNFFFIEVNTRIQVEHGVTEMVTGVDLVKEQVKLASGAKLALKQENINMVGYAIECRINAEDPLTNFSPSIGTITGYLPPGGPGIRVNSICHTGFKVLPEYDSLLSLLICYDKTRHEGMEKMKGALKEYQITGVKTTIPFHLAVLNNAVFSKGKVTTSFIAKNNIIKYVRRYIKEKKSTLTDPQKTIIVTTAVAKYMEKKNKMQEKQDSWVRAGRQELMEQNPDA